MWDDSVSVELTGEKTRTEFRERLDYRSPRGSVEKPSRKPHNQLEERDARVASRVDAAWWTAASAAVLVIATTGTVFHWPTKATVAAAVTAAAQASLRLFFSLPFFLFPPFFFFFSFFPLPPPPPPLPRSNHLLDTRLRRPWVTRQPLCVSGTRSCFHVDTFTFSKDRFSSAKRKFLRVKF